MKISSKSILSPGRARDPPISLSNSLSRRLRNGSIKGGQASPMFPTAGKRRGCGFENPEPSSPKVTCIGQVRVKSKKKQGKNLRTLSRRRSGEVSFRKLEQFRDGVSQNQALNQNLVPIPNYQPGNTSNQECLPGQRNQRWVHLPLTICEALRAFGSEFSCLFPCKSSCFSTSEREKEEKATMGSSEGADNGQSSCGAVFARWLVALQEGEVGRGGREIELVVGGDEERTEFTEMPARSSRRHVFDDLEIIDNQIGLKDEVVGEEEARVSICLPPKNALLLMRCRSDPMKMEALASRFWEPPVTINDEDDEENGDEEERQDVKECEDIEMVLVQLNEEPEKVESQTDLGMEVKQENQEEGLEISEEEVHEETEVNQTVVEEEDLFLGSLFEEVVDQDIEEIEDDPDQDEEAETRLSSAMEDCEEAALAEVAALLEFEAEESTAEKGRPLEDVVTQERSEPLEETQEEDDEGEGAETEERERVLEKESEFQVKEKEEERESRRVLPDCLLLMMCEPKLSMEVSKETWVCSTDFIRRQPEKKKQQPVKPIDGGDESNKKRVSIESGSKSNAAPATHHQRLLQQQPPRWSCSFPALSPASSMATMIEQKLVNAVGYEPFVLTRCKSEPVRTAAAKFVPDTCFWKNRKLEPLRRAAFGVGAAGVGY